MRIVNFEIKLWIDNIVIYYMDGLKEGIVLG